MDLSGRVWAGLDGRTGGPLSGNLKGSGGDGSAVGRLSVFCWRDRGGTRGKGGDAWRSFLDGLYGDISILICGTYVGYSTD